MDSGQTPIHMKPNAMKAALRRSVVFPVVRRWAVVRQLPMARDSQSIALEPDEIGPGGADPPADTGSGERVASGEPPRWLSPGWRAVAGVLILLVPATLALVGWELHTSTLQSRWFSGYASRLSWQVRPGPAPETLQAP